MPNKSIQLAGTLQGRNSNPSAFSSLDQNFLNCVPELIMNPVTQQGELWVNKFPAFPALGGALSATMTQSMIWSGYKNYVVFAGTNGGNLEVFAASDGTLKVLALSATTQCIGLSETNISTIAVLVILVKEAANISAYYLFADAGAAGAVPTTTTVTFTGTTHSNTTMDSIASTAGMHTGQVITGTGISGTNYIASVDSGTAITLTVATSSSTTATFTRTTASKIIDADFPAIGSGALADRAIVPNAVHMDGFMFVACHDQTVWNSDVNSLQNWTATSFGTANALPDIVTGLARLKDYIVIGGSNGMEFYVNVGNASGTVLQRVAHLATQIGVYADVTGFPTVRAMYVMDDVLYWISVTTNQGSGKISVHRMQSIGVSEPIGNPFIDKLLNDAVYTGTTLEILGGGTVHGQKFLTLRIGTRAFNYYLETKIWWEQNIITAGWICAAWGITYAANGTTTPVGAVPHSPSYASVTMTIRTQPLDLGTRERIFWDAFEIVGDKPSTSGTATLSYSDDDYTTTVTAGTPDPSTGREYVRRLGVTGNERKGRSWTYTDSVNRPRRIKQFDLTYRIGS